VRLVKEARNRISVKLALGFHAPGDEFHQLIKMVPKCSAQEVLAGFASLFRGGKMNGQFIVKMHALLIRSSVTNPLFHSGRAREVFHYLGSHLTTSISNVTVTVLSVSPYIAAKPRPLPSPDVGCNKMQLHAQPCRDTRVLAVTLTFSQLQAQP
jgi:hypothetical protein